MRGADYLQESLFTVRKLDGFVPATHPLRPLRDRVNQALVRLDGLFARMYADDIKGGRPRIAPEKPLRAMLLQVFYSVRSERQLMEQIQYNLLFRWFVGLAMDDAVWVPTVFSKKRERLIEHHVIVALFNEVLAQAEQEGWLSGEHSSVDGTLIQAWTDHKSFIRKDGDDGDGSDFRDKPRSNDTHASRTDPDARLYRKGNTASELRYIGHTLSDNRHGLIANARVTQADGHAEREAAKVMIADAVQATANDTQVTLGSDKGYDATEFVEALQEMNVIPHVAQNTSNRLSAVPDEVAATDGYATSQRKCKLIEQDFGWAKFIGPIRQVMVCGLAKVDQVFMLAMISYNLVRMRTLGQLRLQSGQMT